jgi:hypothetical protein
MCSIYASTPNTKVQNYLPLPQVASAWYKMQKGQQFDSVLPVSRDAIARLHGSFPALLGLAPP